VDVYVNYLRRKLKDPPPGQLIRTVRGQGYMVPPESDLSLPVLAALTVRETLPSASALEVH
jgi:DNA-binding winged helix-turn-helix (wHTH) protein